MSDKKENFLSKYANIPEDLRGEMVVVIDGKTYTWDSAYYEIKKGSKLADKILNTLSTIGLI